MVTLAVRYNFSITSGLRSKKRNADLKGHENSRHLLGLAVDVVLDDDEDEEFFLGDVRRLGLRYKKGDTYIHVQAP